MINGGPSIHLVFTEEYQKRSACPRIYLYHAFMVLKKPIQLKHINKSINQVHLLSISSRNRQNLSSWRRDPPGPRPRPHLGTHELAWMKSRCSWARRSAAYLSSMPSNATRATQRDKYTWPAAVRLHPPPHPRPRPRAEAGLSKHVLPLAAGPRSSPCTVDPVVSEVGCCLVLEPQFENDASELGFPGIEVYVTFSDGCSPPCSSQSLPRGKMEPKTGIRIWFEMITHLHKIVGERGRQSRTVRGR